MELPILSGSGIFNSEILGIKSRELSPERTVTEYEIEFYTGPGTYGLCNGERIPYEPGVLAVYRPGDVRQSLLHFRCRYLHVIVGDREIASRLDALPRFTYMRNTDRVSQLYEKTDLLFPVRDDGSALRFTAYLLSLIADIRDERRFLSDDAPDRKISNAVAAARAYMEKYYGSPITLADIAQAVHLTPNHLCTLFSSVCGISPHAYLVGIRIDRAKYLLRSSTMNITEIAMNVGVSSYNYFSALFLRKTGMTPTQYRMESRKQAYIL